MVDRLGRVMDNLSLAMTEDPDFVSSLNGDELREALVHVLSGEEVSVRVLVNGSPTFTVGVPFVRSEKVLGAVLIRTKAQAVEGGISELLWPMLAMVILITLAAGVAVFFFIRSLMKPLQTLTGAARAISEGDFSVRVQNQGSCAGRSIPWPSASLRMKRAAGSLSPMSAMNCAARLRPSPGLCRACWTGPSRRKTMSSICMWSKMRPGA